MLLTQPNIMYLSMFHGILFSYINIVGYLFMQYENYSRAICSNQCHGHHCAIVRSSYSSRIIFENHTLGRFPIKLQGILGKQVKN